MTAATGRAGQRYQRRQVPDPGDVARRMGASVVIPTRDRSDALKRLLGSLEANASIREILVVDDASEMPARVSGSLVRSIRLDRRAFVSAARNRGADAAVGEILVFADDDCVAAPQAIDELVAMFTLDERIALVGPVICYLDAPDTVWCAGVERTPWLGRTRFRGRGLAVEHLPVESSDPMDFPSVFAVRRDCFEEIGGFDAVRFPMHMEEADLAARLRERGWRVVLARDALFWHDLPRHEPVARQLHITDRERARLAGRSRSRFIRRHSKDRLRQTLTAAAWIGVLAPAYVAAILTDRGRPAAERLALARAFAAGTLEGLVDRPETRSDKTSAAARPRTGQTPGSLVPWLVAGLAIRLAVAPFTSHPFDMAVWISHQARFFGAGLDPLVDWKFSLPMMGILLAAFVPAAVTSQMFGIPQVLSLHLWIKLPFIAADLGTAIVLERLVTTLTGRQRDGRLAALFWLFSPVTIFYTAVHGQFDVLTAFLIVLGMYHVVRGREAAGIAPFLLAGLAKYVGFLLLPLEWAWDRRLRTSSRTVRLVACSGVVLLIGYTTLALPGLRSSVLSGLGSSVAGTRPSLWSIWAFMEDTRLLGVVWTVLFVAVYVFVAVRLLRTSRAGRREPVELIGAAAAVLAALISLGPFGNPQFYLWILPLFVPLAFVRRSLMMLGLATVVGWLGLIAFWRSESAAIWFVNAIPDGEALRAMLLPPSDFVDVGAARLPGFLYAAGVMVLGTLALLHHQVPQVGRRERSVSNSRVGIGIVAAGAAVSGCFVFVALQPVALAAYGSAPDLPADIASLNTFPAAAVDGSRPRRLEVSWLPQRAGLIENAGDRASLLVVGIDPYPPVIAHTGSGDPVEIGVGGVAVTFDLLRPTHHLVVRVLLSSGGVSSLEPTFVLWAERAEADVRLTTRVEDLSSENRKLFQLEQTDQLRGRRFRLQVVAPTDSSWLWDGTPTGRGDRWLQVWALPDPPRRALAGTVLRLRADGRLQMSSPLDVFNSAAETSVPVPAGLGPSEAEVFARIDVASSPWWRRALGLSLAGWLLAVAGPALVAIVVWKLSEWAWRGRRIAE